MSNPPMTDKHPGVPDSSMFRTPEQVRRRWLAICAGKRPIWEEDYAQLQRLLLASAIEARRAATGNTDAVEDESAAPQEDAQTQPGTDHAD